MARIETAGPVLVTGFGPFLSIAHNPSELAVRGYADRADPGVVAAVLPVDVDGGPLRALELVQEHGAAAVIALGVDATRPAVMVERLAVNLYEHGGQSRSLTPRGPTALWSTLPAIDIAHAIREAHPVALSLSAGAFVCNATLYRLLEAGVPSIFVHVPADLDPQTGADVIAAAVRVVRRAVVPMAV